MNCRYYFRVAYNYCPRCGQENSRLKMSVRGLLSELFEDYVSLDSRFGRSIKPFFFQPGLLTVRFMRGHRIRYANPVRLYLLISLFHFFILSQTYDNTEIPQMDALQSQMENLQSHVVNLQKISSDTTVVPDVFSLDFQENFSKLQDSIMNIPVFEGSLPETIIIQEKTHELLQRMIQEERSVMEILGTIIARQKHKLNQSEDHILERYLLQNIPVLMFILLPLYAVILKLFFRKKYYINHIIHSLHLHSFLFIALTPFWIYGIFQGLNVNGAILVAGITTIYTIFSFRKVYRIPFGRSSLMVALSGLLYAIAISFSFVIMVLISFFTF